jgi:hypothetical protein
MLEGGNQMRLIIALLALMWLLIIIGAVKYKQEVTALAYNCYFEARNSTTEDQIATMVTVMNRGTPSVEVYKKDQFSWTNEYAEPADNPALDKCKALAKMVYNNHNLFKSKDICKHYAAVSAKFSEGHWTKTFKRRTQIGKHYYYCN